MAKKARRKAKLGSGARFKSLKRKLAKRGAKNPAALAAHIGRKKYGAKKNGSHGQSRPKTQTQVKAKLQAIAARRPLIVGWTWIALCIPAFLWWQESVPFLVAMSIYANIESSFATNAAKKETREMQDCFNQMMQKLDTIQGRL